MANKAPVFTVRVGGIQLSVWSNETEKGVMNSITMDKSYKDKAGKWQTTKSFKGNDLPLIELGIQEVMKFLYLKDMATKPDDAEKIPF